MKKGLKWLISLSLVLMVGVLFSTKVNAEVLVEVENIENDAWNRKIFHVKGDGDFTNDLFEQKINNLAELGENDEIYLEGNITITSGTYDNTIGIFGNVVINDGKFNNTITVNGGNLTFNNGEISALYFPNTSKYGSFVMNGGVVTGNNNISVLITEAFLSNGNIELKNGIIKNNTKTMGAIRINSYKKLDIATILEKLIPEEYEMTPNNFTENVEYGSNLSNSLYTYDSATEIKLQSKNHNTNIDIDDKKEEEIKIEEVKKEETKNEEQIKDLTTTDSKEPKTSISAEKSFPTESKLSVKSISIPDSIKKVEKNIKKIYDISVLNSNAEIIPVSDNKMKITINLDEDLKGYKAYEVVYIKDDKIVERIPATVKDGKLTFTTTHLSEYGIIAYNTVKTGDNILVYTAMLILSVLGFSIVAYKKIRQ